MRSKRKNKTTKQPSNMQRLVKSLKQKDIPLDEFLETLDGFKDTFFENPELEMELIVSNGLPIELEDDNVYLKTTRNKIEEQTFCIVDIETNGSDVQRGQIIELGAVKYKNGEIIDKFDTLVYAKDIPKYIQEVTKITPNMLKTAPCLEKVLEEFKIFLEDDVFVAHDIKFDYNFISDSFKKYDLGKLENRKLCTIDLSKRTIESQRYGLDFLKKLLNIDISNHHRAYSDALSATYILKKALKKLPENIITTEDLITFSKSNNIIKYKE